MAARKSDRVVCELDPPNWPIPAVAVALQRPRVHATDSSATKMTTGVDRKPLVHDQVLVEGEFDGKLIGFRAVVVNVKPAAIWLGLARPDPRLEQLTPDQPLQLTFRRDNAGMIAASSFLGLLGASRSRLFSVSWPDDPRLIQRWADLRLDTECPVEFTA